MAQVNVYDLNWNYLRCYWCKLPLGNIKPGHITKVGKELHKYLF